MDDMQKLMKEAEKAVLNPPVKAPNPLNSPIIPVIKQYSRKARICPHCGTIGGGKNAVKGNIGMEIILWLFCLLPGIFYSIWRLTTKTKVCFACGAEGLIPLDSPMGRKLLAQFGDQQ
jgi:hypothetical protein